MKLHQIKLDPWQQEFIATKGDKILCCGRQVGKSVICGIDAGEYALNHKDKTILMIAPTERQAFALFEKTLDYISKTQPKMIKKGKFRPTKTKIHLNNGTKVWCLPTGLSGLGIRFLTVDRLYADEASRIPDDVWTAVTPMMLTTGGDSIYLSTPAGKDGYFYETWNNKDDAFKSFKRFSVNSMDVISNRELCDTWNEHQRNKGIEHLEREKKRMSLLQYSQEYEGEFIDELRQFFPTELIKDCMTIVGRSVYVPGAKTYAGLDVARMGGDDTVLVSTQMKNERMLMIDMEITTNTYLTDTVRMVQNANRKYDYRKIYIDDGGLGVGVFDPLLEDPNTKRKVEAINNSSRSLDKDGQRGKRLLKEDLYTNLLRLMEQGKIKFFDSDELFHSMKSVQAEYSGGKMRIFGNDTHITEALIRAAWGFKDKSLNIYIY